MGWSSETGQSRSTKMGSGYHRDPAIQWFLRTQVFEIFFE
jgi:hypothetical protein